MKVCALTSTDAVQNEDEENELKSVGWRVQFHFCSIHGHPFEVELIIWEIS
jgi:hypothetical protein